MEIWRRTCKVCRVPKFTPSCLIAWIISFKEKQGGIKNAQANMNGKSAQEASFPKSIPISST